MSLIDCVNWPQKPIGISLADGVIYPLRSALNYARSIEVIDSSRISVQEAKDSPFMRVVYVIISLVISPFIFCALIYKNFDEALSSKSKMIADRVDSVVEALDSVIEALAGEIVDMRHIEPYLPLVRSQVLDDRFREINTKIREIRENTESCQVESCQVWVRLYQGRTRIMEQLTQRLAQTEEEVDARYVLRFCQEKNFALPIDRESREALDGAKEAWTVAKSELKQGIARRAQQNIVQLELASREMEAFDFSSEAEDFPFRNVRPTIRLNRDNPLYEALQTARIVYERGCVELQNKRVHYIRALEESLAAIKRRTQAFKETDFGCCTRAFVDDLIFYEPTLLPGFYPEGLRQRARRLQADCLEAKSRFQGRLTASGQEYAEQKRVFQQETDVFLERIQREGLQLKDYDHWIKLVSLYETLKKHYYVKGDAEVSMLFDKASDSTRVSIQTQDNFCIGLNALELAQESPFFRALFFGSMKETQEEMKQGRPILIKGISREQLCCLLTKEYPSGGMDFSSLAELYQVALYLQLPQQVDALEGMIIGLLTDATFGAFVVLAMISYSKRLAEHAEQYFTQKVDLIRVEHAEVETSIERCEHQLRNQYSALKNILQLESQLADLERHLKSLEGLKIVLREQIEMWKSEEPTELLECKKAKVHSYLERIDELVSSIPLSQRKTRVVDLQILFRTIDRANQAVLRMEREARKRNEREGHESEMKESSGLFLADLENEVLREPSNPFEVISRNGW